ncbi:MAG: FAD-dependent oxidoreductase [Roseburia sp.]|nr:FAD-dependent oxidoreductase [Roseburia sp.]
MITINQLKTELVFRNRRLCASELPDKPEILRKKAAGLLGISAEEIQSVTILKHSIDARKKPTLYQVYTLGVELADSRREERLVRRCRNAGITISRREDYIFPETGQKTLPHRPVIVGTGPAGLFCGYMLAMHGYQPVLLERGQDVDTRTRDVEAFWQCGRLNPESNVQFGEGGAGTFSDGKLNTLVKDKNGRNREVLRILAACGAPEEILYESKPHIGTDILKKVVLNMRERIIGSGGSVRFGAKMTGIELHDGCVRAVLVNGRERIETSQLVLAIGHSARDTFAWLYEMGLPMEAKAFAVGMRVEHPQALINACMYGREHGNELPAAPYKLTAKTGQNRGVYSFCMCPGGYIVNASSEEGRLAVNGMSYSDRLGQNANSAIIVQVTPEDYGGEGALAGVEFQRRLEERAFAAGNGAVPVQYYGDYKQDKISTELTDQGSQSPSIKGAYTFTNLRGLLPDSCEEAFMEGMEQFDRTIRGFAGDRVLLAGVESRTSSPVRICRDNTLQCPTARGLYPCGEGAGYAGGITSAAMDGILVAEQIAKQFRSLGY